MLDYATCVGYFVIYQGAKTESHTIQTFGGEASQFIPAIVKPVTDDPVCTPLSLLSQHAVLPGAAR
jgi:hypothetical protein